MEVTNMIYFGLTISVISLFLLSTIPVFAQDYDEFGNEIMDQMTSGVETGISSIDVPEDNILDTNQEEVNNLAHSTSEWLKSLFDFGKKTHHVTEDVMSVASPSWVDQIIIALVAGAVVVFIMWKVIKKVGIHLAIGMGALAAVIVLLMLLDLNS